MKIAIITINEAKPNYGNRLQNYASKVVLEQFGADVSTLCFDKSIRHIRILKRKRWLHKLSFYKLSKSSDYWKYDVERICAFEDFNRRYISQLCIDSCEHLSEEFDYFAVGSDQVWNANWYEGNSLKKDLYLLTFAKPEQKICMAPSFGIDELPDAWNDYFKKQLPTFPNLLVREKSGADLIYRLTGQKAEIMIDPTLLLTAEDWLKIAQRPKNVDCNKRYILTYFLGGRSKTQDQYIQELTQKYNLTVYNLLDKSNRELFVVDPGEFVYLIAHAELVLTDSFHACVFAFLFHKPFQVFARGGTQTKMFSRIENLLTMLSLERKYAGSGLKNKLFECDYEVSLKRLESERSKARTFLNRSLGVQHEN